MLRKQHFCVPLILLLSWMVPLTAHADATQQLEQLLGHWQSVEGSFKQKIYDNDTEELMNSTEGSVYLEKPGKLRWQVTSRDKTLVVSDGKQIWHYDPELEQATVDKFDPNGTSPLLFLTAKSLQLNKDFDVKSVSPLLCGKTVDVCFEMKPHQSEAVFLWTRIGFEKGSLKSLEFLDQLGEHGWITFSKMKVNKPISDSLFHFTAPKGTDIIRR